MISLFVPTEQQTSIRNIIASEERLHELVSVYPAEHIEYAQTAYHILVNETHIRLFPDWYNVLPPVLYPEQIPFSSTNLLGLIFARLGNYEKANSCLAGSPDLYCCTDLINRLQYQVPLTHELIQALHALPDNAIRLHNLAIAAHYGAGIDDLSFETLANQYEQAIIAAANDNQRAFTAKHFAILLTDMAQLHDASHLLHEQLKLTLPEDARYGLQLVQCQAWLQQLTVPYDPVLLEKLKEQLWDNLQYLEKTNRTTEEALLLIDAAQIANMSDSFSESLGYISKAIKLLQQDNQTELLANAQLKKGILLYTWAQQGQPQFYRGAKDALLAALSVFTRDTAPEVFADIHHYLGIVYAEIADEAAKRSLWAAVSVSSFNEALSFYNKVDYPYEFAMICHHFGNAYTKYPAAIHSDNYDKALAWYREALDIRTPDRYPIERCHTLSNYLDASWRAANPDTAFNTDRYEDMWQKAAELQQLTASEDLRDEATEHLQKLKELKATVEREV
jgi:hypothetical protein